MKTDTQIHKARRKLEELRAVRRKFTDAIIEAQDAGDKVLQADLRARRDANEAKIEQLAETGYLRTSHEVRNGFAAQAFGTI